ncbi:aldehyde dehydrogenase family protein [Agrococcus baldri]|uniref:NAD-dependent succinate-semialdehyde dehydrogenase n=1 Tax=Agrococcus baldri TaxID=153730 RepID=A0AA87UR70_9MICO|nr:aldehyde dehydrogenase family protein [Agrococcus baldri]GEK79214.1 NAD-dependent succinate-semialdehyde dehydrogenase [Agrococcus baldri]
MTATMTVPGARIAGATEPGTAHAVVRAADGTAFAQAGWVDAGVVDRAVAAASAARADWGATPARDRAAALRAIAAELRTMTAELGSIIAAESGKRVPEAEAEVGFSARYFDWFADAAVIAEQESGYVTPMRRFRVRHHPVGVVAALGTWNFPLSIPARKIAASIAAGCPTVLKASERTPVSADRLVALCERHLPAGVIGAVMGGPEVATALIDHPQVAAVTFTGSTAVGQQVGARAAASSTRAVLELGGRAPFIIRADADVSDAVEHLLVAKLRNNGESCIAANNVFVHTSQRDAVWAALSERIRTVRPGAPEDADAQLGPMIDASAAIRLEQLIGQAAEAGAAVVRGMDGPSTGTYVAAALVDCDGESELWDREVFGPVIALRSFVDEDALVEEVNGWGVGLAGYVCGVDVIAAEALAERLRIGIVGINNGAPNTPEVPFGGFGGSGIGREGGMSGYLAFVEEQTISIAR